MNRDFVEMLRALSDAGAEYLVVGAHAMAVHGCPRATGDLDLWVNPSAENARRVWRALSAFGAPLVDLKLDDLSASDVVFQIGLPPCRIDLLTHVDGVDFATAWRNRKEITVGEVPAHVLGREQLLANKRAAGRPRDLADVAWLESARDPGEDPGEPA